MCAVKVLKTINDAWRIVSVYGTLKRCSKTFLIPCFVLCSSPLPFLFHCQVTYIVMCCQVFDSPEIKCRTQEFQGRVTQRFLIARLYLHLLVFSFSQWCSEPLLLISIFSLLFVDLILLVLKKESSTSGRTFPVNIAGWNVEFCRACIHQFFSFFFFLLS